MTDAQPADQLVAALEAALAWLLDSGSPAGLLGDMEVALPIAREMAERERELWAALGKARQDNLTLQRERGRRFDEVERLSNRIDELTQENVWLKRLIADAPTAYERIASELALDRARAAGAEVTGHE